MAVKTTYISIRRLLRLLPVTSSLLLGVVSCNNKSGEHKQQSSNVTNAAKVPISTAEDEMNKSLAVGTPKSEVDNAFGAPSNIVKIDQHFSVADYRVRVRNKTPQLTNLLSGFTVTYENDVVVKWNPTYLSFYATTGQSNSPSMWQTNTGSSNIVSNRATVRPQLAFYETYSVNISDLNYTNSDEVLKMKSGLLVPTIVITNIKAMLDARKGINDGASRGEIGIQLDDNDIQAFKQFTLQNLLKPVIVALNNEPVATLIIYSPITTGKFNFQVEDQNEYLKLQQGLAHMMGYTNEPKPK